mmetsp:Transcript_13195/g.22608  ORF Transcript_13195/g.22608 Transcript_13195/m.22608 type:complete len:89 (-) Transcript_13195:621-887(-)
MDNYQRRRKNRHKRGGQGNGFLSGTNQRVHKVNLYEDPSHDDCYTDLDYSPDQCTQSPFLMPHYESEESVTSASFFKNHKFMQKEDGY